VPKGPEVAHSTLFMIKIVEEARSQLIHVYAKVHTMEKTPSKRVCDLAKYVSMNGFETHVEHDDSHDKRNSIVVRRV